MGNDVLRNEMQIEGGKLDPAKLQEFDFKRATPGMADLMRRLYSIRVDCTGNDEQKAQEEAEKKKLEAMKKLDAFEYNKYLIMQDIDNIKKMIDQRKQDPDDKRLSNDIRKAIAKVDQSYEKLKELQTHARKGISIWAKVKIDPNVQNQREQDLKNVAKHIDAVKAANRKMALGDKASNSDSDFKPKHKANFKSVDDLDNEPKEEELPTIDISVALKIIEDNKQKQIDILKDIEAQVDTMAAMANTMSDELAVQSKMLDKISDDVDKYTKELEGLNKTLDSAIAKAGGPTRLLFIAIGLIVLLACIGLGYFALKAANILP